MTRKNHTPEEIVAKLQKAVSALTLDKLILKEAAGGNCWGPRGAGRASSASGSLRPSRSVGPVRRSASTVRHSARSCGAAACKHFGKHQGVWVARMLEKKPLIFWPLHSPTRWPTEFGQ